MTKQVRHIFKTFVQRSLKISLLLADLLKAAFPTGFGVAKTCFFFYFCSVQNKIIVD